MTKTMSPELATLCVELKQWRQQGGGRGRRVPSALWRQAATVAQTDGAYKTARATRLNYERLRALLAKREAPETERETRAETARAAAQFIAVQMDPATRAPSLTIELTRESGERMRIESAGTLDLASVVQAFWRRS